MMQQHEDVGHGARAVQRPFQAFCRMDGVLFQAWFGAVPHLYTKAGTDVAEDFLTPYLDASGVQFQFFHRDLFVSCPSIYPAKNHAAKWLVKSVDVEK